jgi:hypothetical protein
MIPEVRTAILVAGIAVANWAIGFALPRFAFPPAWLRIAAWGSAFATVAATNFAMHRQPGLARSLAFVITGLAAMKAVVATEAGIKGTRLPLPRWLLFIVFWPGMRLAVFQTRERPRRGSGLLLRDGCLYFAGGFVLWSILWMFGPPGPTASFVTIWVFTLPALASLSMMLHFGLFDALSGIYRYFGYNAIALFRAPLRSSSLEDFWGRRWNLAFVEMATQIAYRPVSDRFGPGAGRWVVFLMSGLLHEMAISLPVRQGFGLPTLYFILQCIGLHAEVRLTPGLQRVFALAVILLPLPLLFHRAFLAAFVWPLFGGQLAPL